jgi:hypothetical protein
MGEGHDEAWPAFVRRLRCTDHMTEITWMVLDMKLTKQRRNGIGFRISTLSLLRAVNPTQGS